MMNLGTLSLVLMLYSFKILVVFCIIWPLHYCIPTLSGVYKKWKTQIFFNDFFMIIYEGYFVIMLCCFFNLNAPAGNSDKNATNSSISILLLILLIIIVPGILLMIATRPFSLLDSFGFKERWEKAYHGIDYRYKVNLLFRIWFCVRRILFISSLYLIPEYPAF